MIGEERYIEIEALEKKYKVWTKKFGDNPYVKILLLHGGPGGSSNLMHSFEENLKDTSYEFYYYNQLGSYKSDNPLDKNLWTIERYVEEVEQVRKALNLTKDNFYLLGQSWGGMLAMEYALRYQENLKALIISSMQASIPDYVKYENEVLAKQLDPSSLDEIRRLEEKGDYGDRYDELLKPFYEKFVLRKPMEEWPQTLLEVFDHMNNEIYNYMNGPSEFGCSGTFKDWDVKNQLHQIKIPTLVIGSTYNTMDPNQLQWMANEVQNGYYHHCENGSHMCSWDDSDTYFSGLINFIESNEN